jgi:hypothetical protein
VSAVLGIEAHLDVHRWTTNLDVLFSSPSENDGDKSASLQINEVVVKTDSFDLCRFSGVKIDFNRAEIHVGLRSAPSDQLTPQGNWEKLIIRSNLLFVL